MKRLILMRHAKSDWSNASASDHERTLNDRGVTSARAVGDWLKSRNILPDHVLCSDAARTAETLSLLAFHNVPTTMTRDLYLAEPDVMAHLLRQQAVQTTLMVAHNPGCAFLADALVSRRPDHAAFDRFPTAATLVVDFEIETWRDLRSGTGTIAEFVVPRDLG